MPAGNYSNLQTGQEGHVYYLEAQATERGPWAKGAKLHKYDLKEREDKVIMSDVKAYEISADKKKILYKSEGSWRIIPVSGEIEHGQGKLKTDAIEILIDPRSEWKQIFHVNVEQGSYEEYGECNEKPCYDHVLDAPRLFGADEIETC